MSTKLTQSEIEKELQKAEYKKLKGKEKGILIPKKKKDVTKNN
jgi:hypothetical protein